MTVLNEHLKDLHDTWGIESEMLGDIGDRMKEFALDVLHDRHLQAQLLEEDEIEE